MDESVFAVYLRGAGSERCIHLVDDDRVQYSLGISEHIVLSTGGDVGDS